MRDRGRFADILHATSPSHDVRKAWGAWTAVVVVAKPNVLCSLWAGEDGGRIKA